MQQAEINTGKKLIDLPPINADLMQIWHIFMDFSMARQASQAGLQPMQWTEFEAFGRMRGLTMSKDLVRIIRKLEQILLKFATEQMKKAMST